jgi:hypothetical protein
MSDWGRVTRAVLAVVLLAGMSSMSGCAAGDSGDPSAKAKLRTALERTWSAGSAAVHERAWSRPAGFDYEVTGRSRFDYDNASLTITYGRHPAYPVGTSFDVVIDSFPYVRTGAHRWYVPGYGNPQFELGYADLLHLLEKTIGRVRELEDSSGDGTALAVSVDRVKLDRLRGSVQGSLDPLGLFYALRGPIRVELDDAGRIKTLSYDFSGGAYAYGTYIEKMSVLTNFSDFDDDFRAEAPPEDEVTSRPPGHRDPAADASS